VSWVGWYYRRVHWVCVQVSDARMALQEHILGTLDLHDAMQDGVLGGLERFMRLITTQRRGMIRWM
jgi:hypothetical protein